MSASASSFEVVRDDRGIPHVRADSAWDAFFGQGWVHAQDRLWQLDHDRRRAAGRAAERLGPSAVPLDALMRRMGIARAARADYDALDATIPAQAETRAMFDAFASGVNAWMERAASTGRLPVEFDLLAETPEPWMPWDSCAVYKVRHALMGSMAPKLWRARMSATLGPADDGEADAVAELWDWNAGSNNWAVHGSRTASGMPLLAGDPHRLIDVPNVYYQNHIACPEFDVIGFSIAGVPGFSHFGHNADVAWCITHGMADTQDLYIEHFDPTGQQYETEDGWMPAATRTETIHVLGADPVELEITETRHGPIVVGTPRGGTALALRSTLTEQPGRGFAAFVPMLRARTVAELDATMRDWVDPVNNLVMADRSGSIELLFRGRIPIRSEGSAWAPVPGWDGRHEWRGDIPFEELPRVVNPESGYLVSANASPVDDDYPYHLSVDWDEPHRAERIADRLDALEAATVDDLAGIHADVLSATAATFADRLHLVTPHTPLEAAALAELTGWDRRMAGNHAAPTIYSVWKQHLVELAIERSAYAGLADAPYPAALPLPLAYRLREPVVAALEAGELDGLYAESFAPAVAWLEQHFGSDVEGWNWGDAHRTGARHPLSVRFPDAGLDPPSVPVAGDDDTVRAAYAERLTEEGFPVTITSVARYVFDLSDWDNSAWIVPLGSSGDPRSPHFADQVGTWAAVRLLPMTYSWDRVEAEARSREVVELPPPASGASRAPG